METKMIEAETATKMSETELMDAVWEAPENSILEIFAADPDGHAGDNDGVHLEVVKLDDEESVVRDRWPNQDNSRHMVRTKDIYSIYRALVDQVEEVAWMAQNTISDCVMIRKRPATQADAFNDVAVGDVITEVRCGNAVWAGPSEEIAMEFAKRWIKYVEVA